MPHGQALGSGRDPRGGWSVDPGRGKRVGRVSFEWICRLNDPERAKPAENDFPSKSCEKGNLPWRCFSGSARNVLPLFSQAQFSCQ